MVDVDTSLLQCHLSVSPIGYDSVDNGISVHCIEESNLSARAILESELEIMKKVAADGHPNILQLIGSSVEGRVLFQTTLQKCMKICYNNANTVAQNQS